MNPKRRVLVVDDNPDAVASLAMLVRQMGHEVQTAATGAAAMQVARFFRPEVVLLDIVLPDMNGCDLAKDLKALPGLLDTQIFAVTGHADDALRNRAYESGCDGYFLKPLEPKVLERLLSKGI
jgi:CheY-like chemotaxis protein